MVVHEPVDLRWTCGLLPPILHSAAAPIKVHVGDPGPSHHQAIFA